MAESDVFVVFPKVGGILAVGSILGNPLTEKSRILRAPFREAAIFYWKSGGFLRLVFPDCLGCTLSCIDTRWQERGWHDEMWRLKTLSNILKLNDKLNWLKTSLFICIEH